MLKILSVLPIINLPASILGICRDPLTIDKEVTMKEPVLPHSYTTVPAVALNAATTSVPERNCQTSLAH